MKIATGMNISVFSKTEMDTTNLSWLISGMLVCLRMFFFFCFLSVDSNQCKKGKGNEHVTIVTCTLCYLNDYWCLFYSAIVLQDKDLFLCELFRYLNETVNFLK